MITDNSWCILNSLRHSRSGDQANALKVAEMASAAGFGSQIDPLLLQTIQALPKQDYEEEYTVSCLLMVFVAVTIPKLARSDSSMYRVRPFLEGTLPNVDINSPNPGLSALYFQESSLTDCITVVH